MAGLTLASAAMYASLAATAVGAYGAYSSGQANAAAAHYQAGVQRQNAAIARENALVAEQAGEAQAGMQALKTKAVIGATLAEEGASGVDVSSESFKNVRTSERVLGEQDAKTVRQNAAREAYGYRARSASEEAQGSLSDFESANAKKAAGINAASTLLGGASSAAGKWQDYKLQGGM